MDERHRRQGEAELEWSAFLRISANARAELQAESVAGSTVLLRQHGQGEQQRIVITPQLQGALPRERTKRDAAATDRDPVTKGASQAVDRHGTLPGDHHLNLS